MNIVYHFLKFSLKEPFPSNNEASLKHNEKISLGSFTAAICNGNKLK